MNSYLLVAAGAVLGACARFFFTHLSSELSHHHGFPYGTLFVNVLGSLLAGFFLASTQPEADSRSRLLVIVGFCGAFTTFSTFAFESMDYFQAGAYGRMALNVALNNVLCLAGILGGGWMARQ